MNCVEFERVLLKGENTPEQQAHLDSCVACSNLLADFDLISSTAKLLLASDEPSPAVWNALEARLVTEGLIRRAESPRVVGIDFFRRWRTAWLVPVAAVLVLTTVVRLHHPSGAGDNGSVAKQISLKAPPAVSPMISSSSIRWHLARLHSWQSIEPISTTPMLSFAMRNRLSRATPTMFTGSKC